MKELIFIFAGFTDSWNEKVMSYASGAQYILKDNTIFTDEKKDIVMHTLTKRFKSGRYIGKGCLGNGVTYWDKEVFEYGDYKKIGHISDNGILSIYAPYDKDEVLISYLEMEKSKFKKVA